MSTTMSKSRKRVNIEVFLDEQGRIKQIPSPNRTRIPVLAYLAGKFDGERKYGEKEVNSIINQWHTFGDYFILRRLLIDYNLMGRTPDGSEYWVMPGNEALALDPDREGAAGQEL